jgi:hypothetical protein
MKNSLLITIFLLLTSIYYSNAGGPPSPCNPPANELCANATAIPVGGCTGAGTSGCDITGDPTVAGLAGCGPAGSGSSWYTFVAPASGNADITVTLSGGFYGAIVLYSGACGAQTEVDCYYPAPAANPYTANFVGLTPGLTYHFMLNSAGVGSGGTNDGQTSFSSICVVDPIILGGCASDDCNFPSPFSLNTAGGGPSCITSCNTGAALGPDFAGNNCEDLPNQTVWFNFTTGPTTNSIDIGLTSVDLSDPEFVLFTTTDCSNFTIFDCTEGTGGAASSGGILVTPNTSYILAVSDVTADFGFFDLCITQNAPAASCVDNQDCNSPAPLTLNPTGGADVCVTDCNNGATSGPVFAGPLVCQDMPFSTVWYEFTTSADAATIDVDLTSTDMPNPEFTVFQTADCATYTTVSCTEGIAGSAAISGQGISPNTTYLIAVSDAGGIDGNFTLCVRQDIDNSACNVDNVLAVTATSMGSPLDGPYQPGEVVTFCYTINSYITGLPGDPTACNYVQGVVPSFGDCWAPASFDANGMPSVITTPLTTVGVISSTGCGGGPPQPWCGCDGTSAGTWSWYPAGSVTYNLNQANPMGHTAGDNVGAGWFFTSSYSSITGGCGAGGNDPNNSYGDNNFPDCSDIGGWQVCFSLIANNETDCLAGEQDCNVSIKTYADGEIGVWQSIGCTADLPTSKPATMICVILSSGLEKFEAVAIEDNNNLLSWKMNGQSEVQEFRVEKSADGLYWTTDGVVLANASASDYSFIDENPYAEITYYRLKIKTPSGQFEQSNIVSVSSTVDHGSGLISAISPNPAREQINFIYTGGNLNENIQISITNMIGQVLIDKVISIAAFNEKCSIETATLADGVYYLRVTQGQSQTVKKISIER